MSSGGHRSIGILTWDFDPPKGGLGRAMQEAAAGLREAGWKVSVAAPSGGSHALFPWTRRCGLHPLFSLLLPFVLHGWLKRCRADTLLLPSGPGGVALLRCPDVRRTVCAVYHTYEQQSRLVPGQRWKRCFIPFERSTLRKADAVLCYAEDTRRVLCDTYGCPRECVHLLPQIFDAQRWSGGDLPTKEPGLCVCVARLDRRKGIDVLLRAWPRVRERMPHARLTVVGAGTFAKPVDAAARGDFGIRRMDALPQEELIALLRRSELALCPSYLEGFGLAALEAMAAGTALIASDTDGLRSLVSSGRTGLLVPPGDPEALADAIISLLGNADERGRLAEAARESVRESVDRDRAIRALHGVLQAL